MIRTFPGNTVARDRWGTARTMGPRPLEGVWKDPGRGETKTRVRPDLYLLVPASILLLFSTVAIFSVVYNPVALEMNPSLRSAWITPFTKQMLYLALGLLLFASVLRLDPETLKRYSLKAYGAGLLALLGIIILGTEVNGARSWIRLGGLSFQPSEFVKPLIILALAAYLSREDSPRGAVKPLIVSSLIVLIPTGLVLLQPDAGTAMVYLVILAVLPFAAGLPSRYLILTLLAGGAFAGRILAETLQGAFHYLPPGVLVDAIMEPGVVLRIAAIGIPIGLAASGWLFFSKRDHALTPLLFSTLPAGAYLASFPASSFLKAYQRARIISFLAPGTDPRGSGYNVIQSCVAVGSGGIWGKGMSGATQSVLGFLPESRTDFIFSVLGEEFGFIGALILLLSFAVIVGRLLYLAIQSEEKFNGIILVGVATVITFHVAVNVGMTIGLVPIMGIPLPLVSYGGSSILATFLCLGLAHVASRRSLACGSDRRLGSIVYLRRSDEYQG